MLLPLIAAFTGVVLTLLGFFYAEMLEHRQLQSIMGRVASSYSARLQNEMSDTQEILDAVSSFINSAGSDREQYRAFVEPILAHHPEIYALHWIPRVDAAHRAQFEQELLREGFKGGIKELVPASNGLTSATQREAYFPILLTEPFAQNSKIVGFDAYSRDLNRKAMDDALNTTLVSALTAPFVLVQDNEGTVAVVLFRPVYAPLQSDQSGPVTGFVAALVKPQRLLDQISGASIPASLRLTDTGNNQQLALLSAPIEGDTIEFTLEHTMLNRPWQLTLYVSGEHLAAIIGPLYSRWIPVLGISFTALLAWMLRRLGRAHAQTLQERDRTQTYLDTVETMMLALNRNGCIEMVNRRGCELLGYAERELLGQNWFQARFLSDPEAQQIRFNAVMQRGDLSLFEPYTESRVLDAQGKSLLIAWHNALRFDEEGRVHSILSAGEDITRKRLLTMLEKVRSEAMQATLKGRSFTFVLELVLKGIEHQKPGALCSILLLDEEGKHLLCGAAPSLPDSYNQIIHGIEIGEGVGSCGTAAFRRQRVVVEDIYTDPLWAPYRELAKQYQLGSCWSEPIFGKGDRLLGTFAVYHSEPTTPSAEDLEIISGTADLVGLLIEGHRAENDLIRLANTDELTGLSNRRRFMEALTQEFSRGGRYGHALSLCMLDIDHFKAVNDRYGHDAGDEVLRRFSQLMQKHLRETDLAARIGGEEFAILLPYAGEEEAVFVAERIRRAVSELQIRFGDETLALTVSAGIAVMDSPEAAPSQASGLLTRADQALYQAKHAGRDRVTLFTADL